MMAQPLIPSTKASKTPRTTRRAKATEDLTAHHLEQALLHGVDALATLRGRIYVRRLLRQAADALDGRAP